MRAREALAWGAAAAALLWAVSERSRAARDPLTGLLNRRGLQQAWSQGVGRQARARRVLHVIDLSGFKGVNDRLGHAAGDRVLAAIAHGLARELAPATVARVGGDEFAVLAATGADPKPAIGRAIAYANLVAGDAAGQAPAGIGFWLASAPAGDGSLDAALASAFGALRAARAEGAPQPPPPARAFNRSST